MKRILLSIFAGATILLVGCAETTQETTFKKDGTGDLKITNDMSSLIGLAKQMGGKDADKMDDEKAVDTTIALSSRVDSIPNLTAQEKAMLAKGTMRMDVNMKESRLVTTINFPFTNPAEISQYSALSGRVMTELMQSKMGDQQIPGMDSMPKPSSIDDYYKNSFSKGLLVRTLDKVKYATVDQDEYLKSMKEMAGMGLPLKTTYIFNLPTPVKKAEGKNLKLSDDKKTVTIVADLDDFYDDATKLEFRIEY